MESVFSIITKGLLPPGTLAYFAGGYAACPERAEDIDLWVRVPTLDALPSFRQQLLDHFTEMGLTFSPLEDRHEYKDDYGEFIGGVLKVAKVPYTPLDVHVMVTDMAPAVLLDAFDVSTHMVAFDGEYQIFGAKWTPLTEEPIAWKMTPTTPERMEKIRNRYADLRINGQG